MFKGSVERNDDIIPDNSDIQKPLENMNNSFEATVFNTTKINQSESYIINEKKPAGKYCPNCGTFSPGKFCLNCGTNMPVTVVTNPVSQSIDESNNQVQDINITNQDTEPVQESIVNPQILEENASIFNHSVEESSVIENPFIQETSPLTNIGQPMIDSNSIFNQSIGDINELNNKTQDSEIANIDNNQIVESVQEPIIGIQDITIEDNSTPIFNQSIGKINEPINQFQNSENIQETIGDIIPQQDITYNPAVENSMIQRNIPENVSFNENTSVPEGIMTSNILANETLEQSGIIDNNKSENVTVSANQVDFFEYDFADETKNQTQPVITETKVADEFLNFDFDAVIREQHTPEVVPIQENRIELTNFLQPKENLIRKMSDPEPQENNVIHIDEDEGKMHRRKRAFMKGALYAFYVFLVFFIAVFAYTFYQQKNAFTLSRNEISLAIGSTYPAEVIKNANIEDNSNYEWSSTDDSIATVSDDGTILAMGKGSATIIVKSKKTRKTRELIVHALSISVESIKFPKNKITLTVGDFRTLSPIINGDETIIIDLIWHSSNEEIVSVDSNGQLIANKAGTATITVYEEISGLSDEMTITVEAKKTSNTNTKTAVTGVSLNKTSANLTVGDTLSVTATVKPTNASNKGVSWSSSNANVATVSQNGKITAKSAGTATITVKTTDGNKTANIKVNVTNPIPTIIAVTGVSLNKNNLSLETGSNETLIATVNPNNATNKNVFWSSSNTNVATVSQNGKVTAVGAGTATITVTTESGGKTAMANITVTNPSIDVTSVTLNKNNLSLEIGSNETLIANVHPGNATNKNVSWSSNNTSIATVSQNGKVTAVSAGTATITVTTIDGRFTATCIITVEDPSEGTS